MDEPLTHCHQATNECSPGGTGVKNPAVSAEGVKTGSIPKLGTGEGPLEREMATHSSILAWEIPWKKTGGL